MTRGSFNEEFHHPTCFTVWVLLPGHTHPVGFDTMDEALEVIMLETWWVFGPESQAGHG